LTKKISIDEFINSPTDSIATHIFDTYKGANGVIMFYEFPAFSSDVLGFDNGQDYKEYEQKNNITDWTVAKE
jgi:hypothetical protein